MKCPNCGADVPTGDLFCGECGNRIVPEERPSPPPPLTSPPAKEPKRGLPKGLLIGAGGLLALIIIAGCILAALKIFGASDPTPTIAPTQVVQKPTDTPTLAPTDTPSPLPTLSPTPTPTPPPPATPTTVTPVFEFITFATGVTDEGKPIDPGATFPAGTIRVYAIFDYSGMQEGMTYNAYWYLDGEETLNISGEWNLEEEGSNWVNIYNDNGLAPGNYELELYIDDQLLLNNKFTIQAGLAGATATNVRFALAESEDDLPLGVGAVFPYGITEVFGFFDYSGFEGVTEIESTWLYEGEVSASGYLDWWGDYSGTDRIRFWDDEPLAAGDYEWQMRISGAEAAGGSFRIEEPVAGWTSYTNTDWDFWLLYPEGWDEEKDPDGVTLLSNAPGELGVLVIVEDMVQPLTAEEKAAEVIDNLSNTYPDIEIVFSDSGLMDGEEAVILGATFTDDDGILNSLLLAQANHGSRTYALMGLSEADVADSFGETMGAIADSFHFLGQTAPAAVTLFYEDFETPTSSWAEKSDENREQGYLDGVYFISVTASDWIAWDTPGYNFDDFSLQVDTLQSSGDAGNAHGVLFRYVDGDNFYRFAITGDGFFSLFKQEKGEWEAIIDWRESVYINPAGELNHLGVFCRGDQISLYTNGQELVTVADDSFAQGDIGLFASAYDVPEIQALFDELWVTE